MSRLPILALVLGVACSNSADVAPPPAPGEPEAPAAQAAGPDAAAGDVPTFPSTRPRTRIAG